MTTQPAEAAPVPVLARSPWDAEGVGPRITRVRTIITAPQTWPLVMVCIETDVPGLVGWGCASSPQRPLAIAKVVDDYLALILVGRRAFDIEDVHRLASLSPYWRGGAIENNALAGVDLALWDIKGKAAGMPVHQLLGGQVRDRVDVYGHADGAEPAAVADDVQRFMEKGYRYVRCQVSVPDSDTYAANKRLDSGDVDRVRNRDLAWRPRAYPRAAISMFETVRAAVGDEVELLHDVHERVAPDEAVRLAHDLDPFHLFFLEDALAPEDVAWYRQMRAHSTTPQAVGEVFSDVSTFIPLVTERLIDFARIRIGALGGITPVRKLVHLCELFGVRLAIHGPGDISPVGHASSIALDASSHAFGIQESVEYSDVLREVFPGAPVLENGAFVVSQAPGLGVEVDESEARKHPPRGPLDLDRWALLRREDGSVARP